MTTFDTILDAGQHQMSLDELLTVIEAEESGPGGGFEPGASVGHSDYPEFRAVYVGPGRRPGQALVRIVAGWSDTPPAWPVTVPYSKLVEV